LVLLAYGPAPGVELIPYFLGLLAWLGAALGAILLSPFVALLRRLRRARGVSQEEPSSEPLTEPMPEAPGEGSPDRV
jgi:hypothetical protein